MRKATMIIIVIALFTMRLKALGQAELNLCDWENILFNLNQTQKNVGLLLRNSSDSCVLVFLDTLTNKAMSSSNSKYFIVLNSFCNASDGYVAEYFEEIVEKMAYHSFVNFTSYMAENRGSCLEQVLLRIMDDAKRKDDMKQLIDKELKKNIPGSKRSFLHNLRDKLSI